MHTIPLRGLDGDQAQVSSLCTHLAQPAERNIPRPIHEGGYLVCICFGCSICSSYRQAV